LLRDYNIIALRAAPGTDAISIDQIVSVRNKVSADGPAKQGNDRLFVLVNDSGYGVIPDDRNPTSQESKPCRR
jgi:hypothetical protein